MSNTTDYKRTAERIQVEHERMHTAISHIQTTSRMLRQQGFLNIFAADVIEAKMRDLLAAQEKWEKNEWMKFHESYKEEL